jgi:uncharacterized membrane protein YfcA
MITSLFISLIFLAAGFTQGLSGFGSALFAMPLLTLFIDVKIAVPLCILNSVLITLYLSLKLKGFMEKKKILPLFLGSLPGIYIGVTFLKNVEADIIKLLLGVLIVSYGFYSLLFKPGPKTIHHLWAYVAGFCTGFIGSAFSAGGPPTIIYTAHTGWSKDYIKATLTGFFLIASSVTAVVHAASGLTNILVLKHFLASAFFVLIGVYAGSLLYGRISKQEYTRVILVTLILLGVMMIVSALKG